MQNTLPHPGTLVPPLEVFAPEPPSSRHMNVTPDHKNAEAELAFRFVTETNTNVFLTGRAGTGKTTFLHRLRDKLNKSYVVVAPTGVAAINAKGTTIHSQLQLPFGLLTPARLASPEASRRLSKQKENVLRRIDLLVIDEVSMVRADVMDAIDHKLQRVRRDTRPFGGVQLLLIGDLHQLPPVVTRDEERDMAALYPTPYFFSAKALQRAGLVTVELQKVYRQTDADFIRLLGEVRANRMTDDILRQLNSRYQADTSAAATEGYITLTSHRRAADDINSARLAETPGKTFTYQAKVSGSFPESSYPTVETLHLKVGAQVMFVKNDREGAYHNGKIGTVTKLEDELVTVDCGADGGEIAVGAVRWENTKYALDKKSKEVDTEVAGSFTQVPLRLAWAITIHKSQGLTFDHVVIDAAAAFAHGQVYVALSRCRSFEGIVLHSQIGNDSVRTDRQVKDYTTEQQANPPTEEALLAARIAYRKQLLTDSFNFKALRLASEQLRRHGLTELRAYAGATAEEFDSLVNFVDDKLRQVSINFATQLQQSFATANLGDDPVPVPARCQQAAAYFKTHTQQLLSTHLDQLDLETDNSDTHERGQELVAAIRREASKLLSSLELLTADTFDPAEMVARRAKLSIDTTSAKKASRSSVPIKTVHPLLHAMLSDWRSAKATEEEVRVSKVLTSRSLRALCVARPTTLAQLAAVEGIGAVRLKASGQEILDVIAKYADSGLSEQAVSGTKASVSSTVSLTVSMYRKDLSVDEIAAERGYTTGTILGHLASGIDAELIDGEELISAEDQQAINIFLDKQDGEMAGAFAEFSGRYDNGVLKVARARWKRERAAT